MTEHNEKISTTEPKASKPWGIELNTFCMLLHLSQLAGFIIPGAGLVLPIIMWATTKDEHPAIHLHGLIVFNWMLSALIYFFVCFILTVILIGAPMMVVLGVLSLVFAIMGAVKANEGVYWPYPMSIDFFGVKRKLAASSDAG